MYLRIVGRAARHGYIRTYVNDVLYRETLLPPPPYPHLIYRRHVLPVARGVLRGGELCLDRPRETGVLQQLWETLGVREATNEEQRK